MISTTLAAADDGLIWDAKELKPTVVSGQPKVAVHFSYTNQSTRAVHIVAVKTSCGCLQAGPDKTEIGAGEKGSIAAVYFIKGLKGIQDASVYVTTDDSTAPVELKVRVEIPDAVLVAPPETVEK